MKKAHIVTHTHWDREWRYPIWENRQYLVDMMDELLEILDTQPDYSCFLMDGQTVMIEDYLEMRPENSEKNADYSKYPDDAIILTVFNTLPYGRNETLRVYIDFPQDMNVWDFDMFDGDKMLEKQIISRKEVTTPVSNLHTRPLPYLVDRYKTVVKIDNIPPMGYKTIYAVKKASLNRKMLFWHDMRKFNGSEIAKTPSLLENKYIKAQVNPNGSLTKTHKGSGRIYPALNYF